MFLTQPTLSFSPSISLFLFPLPFPAYISHFHFLLPIPAFTSCFHFLLSLPASSSCFHFLIPFPQTLPSISQFRLQLVHFHRPTFPLPLTTFDFRLPLPKLTYHLDFQPQNYFSFSSPITLHFPHCPQ